MIQGDSVSGAEPIWMPDIIKESEHLLFVMMGATILCSLIIIAGAIFKYYNLSPVPGIVMVYACLVISGGAIIYLLHRVSKLIEGV